MVIHYFLLFVRYCVALPLCIFFGGVCMLLASLPASWRYDLHIYFLFSNWGCRLLLWVLGVRVTVSGEPLSGEPAIIVANHASALDIILLEALVGAYPHVWLSRVFKVPVLGFLLSRMHVMVNAEAPREAAQSLVRLTRLVRGKERHAIIFPEGARFDDGQIHPFFAGFALLAEKIDRPVRLVYIKNAHKVLARGSFLINTTSPITVLVGPLWRRSADETPEMFIARVRAWFVQHVTQ